MPRMPITTSRPDPASMPAMGKATIPRSQAATERTAIRYCRQVLWAMRILIKILQLPLLQAETLVKVRQTQRLLSRMKGAQSRVANWLYRARIRKSVYQPIPTWCQSSLLVADHLDTFLRLMTKIQSKPWRWNAPRKRASMFPGNLRCLINWKIARTLFECLTSITQGAMMEKQHRIWSSNTAIRT